MEKVNRLRKKKSFLRSRCEIAIKNSKKEFYLSNQAFPICYLGTLVNVSPYLFLHLKYDLLDMLLKEGGDPNVEGRDGSLTLMVCLVVPCQP